MLGYCSAVDKRYLCVHLVFGHFGWHFDLRYRCCVFYGLCIGVVGFGLGSLVRASILSGSLAGFWGGFYFGLRSFVVCLDVVVFWGLVGYCRNECLFTWG